MTKFKILSWVLIPVIVINIAASVLMAYSIYNYSGTITINGTHQDVVLRLSAAIVMMMLFAAGLYFIYKSCIMFMNRGYFNTKSALYLKRGAYILIFKALLGLIWISAHVETSILADKESQFDFISGMSKDITLLIIGFAIIAVSDIIKKGNKLKQENDLTI